MEQPRRDFLRTTSSAVALPGLASILKTAGASWAAETNSRASRDIRAHFPLLGESVNGRRLAYLDSAATTQRPKAVLMSSRSSIYTTTPTLREPCTTWPGAPRGSTTREELRSRGS